MRNLLLILCMMNAGWLHAQSLPDPTRPPQFKQENKVHLQPEERVQLTLGYTLTGQRPLIASINGKRYLVGDQMEDGSVLEEIHPGRVMLSREGRRFEVRMVSTPVKTRLNRE